MRMIEETFNGNKKQSWFVNKFILFDDHGNPENIAGVAIDITERIKAFERIQEQAKLLDIASDAIMVTDTEGNIKYWNKSAENLYGWTEKEVINRKPTELFSTDRPEFNRVLQEVTDNGEWYGDLTHKTRDGKIINVESRWTLVKDKQDIPKSVFVVNTDISERKKTEKQLLQAQRLESIGTLAGGIAHDLNNVLQPILMSIQLLRGFIDAEDDKHQNWIDILEESALRGSGLVQQVLSFARGTEGEQTVFQLKSFIKEIVKILKQTFPKSIEIKTELPDNIWNISADPTKLHQVIMNLCVNARDAMPNGGTLSIRIENQNIDESYSHMNIDASVGPYVIISISDNGTGIPEEHMDKLFDPFFTTKEPGMGTGLGLSIAFSIVRDHGGFIKVYSEPAKGTVFKIYLPALEHPHIEKLKTRKIDKIPGGNGETILLVDDESSVQEITRLTLETNGYEVLTASDGAEALATYMKNKDRIKAVIMDMMMPIMDGVSSIRALYKIDPGIKIIASSGFSDDRSIFSRLDNIKIEDYLSKPYTAETLLKCLQKVLNNKS